MLYSDLTWFTPKSFSLLVDYWCFYKGLVRLQVHIPCKLTTGSPSHNQQNGSTVQPWSRITNTETGGKQSKNCSRDCSSLVNLCQILDHCLQTLKYKTKQNTKKLRSRLLRDLQRSCSHSTGISRWQKT